MRVILAEDHALVRAGFRALLSELGWRQARAGQPGDSRATDALYVS